MIGQHLLARPRLHAVLDRAEPRVVVLSAPTGSGKTSLLRRWSEASAPDRLAWVTLDAEPGDRTTFWQTVLAATGRAGVVPPQDAERLAERAAATDDVPALLAAALGDRPLTLVVDAHERLADDADDALEDLVRLAAPGDL